MEAAQKIASKAAAAGADVGGHRRRLLVAQGPAKCQPGTPFQETYEECDNAPGMRPLISTAGLHQVGAGSTAMHSCMAGQAGAVEAAAMGLAACCLRLVV
jgi:hypothetical protein